jgi:hypothetical protein
MKGGRSLVSVLCSRVWCSPASPPILSPPCSSACTKPKVSCGDLFLSVVSGEVTDNPTSRAIHRNRACTALVWKKLL